MDINISVVDSVAVYESITPQVPYAPVIGTIQNYDSESGWWLDDCDLWYDSSYDWFQNQSDESVWFGRYDDLPALACLRFIIDGAIPAGVRVSSAKISVVSSDYGDIEEVWLYVTDDDDSPAVVYEDADTRPTWADSGSVTTFPTVEEGEGVGYWAGYWPDTNDPAEFDVASLIQFLVDKYDGLASGAHITIWLTGDKDLEEVWGVFYPRDNPYVDEEDYPTLTIEFEDVKGPRGQDTVSLSESVGISISDAPVLYVSRSESVSVSESRSLLVEEALLVSINVSDAVSVTEIPVVDRTLPYGATAFEVPAGISKLSIEAYGMGGTGEAGTASYGGWGGGGGAYSQRTVAVTPGEILTLIIGSNPNAVGVHTEVWRDYDGPSKELLVRAIAGTRLGGDWTNGVGDERYQGGSYSYHWPQAYGMGAGGSGDARYLAVGGHGRDGNGINGGNAWRVGRPGQGGNGGVEGVNGEGGGLAGGGGGGGKGSTSPGVGGSGVIYICTVPPVGTDSVTLSESVSVSVSTVSNLLCSQYDSVELQEWISVYLEGEPLVPYVSVSDSVTVVDSVEVSVPGSPPVEEGVTVWVKVSGEWKQATVWVKDGEWKAATTKTKVSGVWV